MIVTIQTIGGAEFLIEFFNAIAITMKSPEYMSLIHGIVLVGLLFHIFKTAIAGTYMELIKWGAFCYFAFAIMVIPKVSVVIEDKASPGITGAKIDNIPLGLALPAGFISALDTQLAEMFEMNFSLPGEISYINSGMPFGSQLMDAVTKTQIPSELEADLHEFIRLCVYDQLILGNITKTQLKLSSNLKDIILNENNHSNIFHVTYKDKVISCKEASKLLKAEFDNSLQKTLNEISSIVSPFTHKQNPSQAINNTQGQLTDMNDFFLKSSKSALDTLAQGAMINALISGMDKRQSLANSNNEYAKYKAKLTSREGWKVIGANAPMYLIIMKLTIQSLLYALFPIVIIMIMAGIFGFSLLIEYFKALFALALISPIFAIINRLSYGITSIRTTSFSMKALNGDNGMTFSTILPLQEFNADVMAIAGYLSFMSIPIAYQLVQRGFVAMGGTITNAITSSPTSNSNQVANEVVSGNYSLGNVSMGNDSLHNSSKFNINEHNEALGNKSYNNFSRDTISDNVISQNLTRSYRH